MGAGYIGRKQVVKGILITLLEVAIILAEIFVTGPYMIKLNTLGTVQREETLDLVTLTKTVNDYDNSFYVMNSSMCNKIFNREFIEENKIRCLEDVPGEDTYFSMSAFLSAKNVYYIKDIIYYYRQRNTSYKTASVSWNCSMEFFKGMNIAYKKTYEKFVEKNQVQFYRFLYARNMTYLLYRFIDSGKLNNEEKIELLGEMRWFFKLSYTLKVPACQKSLMILIKKIVDGDYVEAINICKIIKEIREYMPVDIRHKMSKPYEEMYKEILKTQF